MENNIYCSNQKGLPKLTHSTFYKTLKFAKGKSNSVIDMNTHNLSSLNDLSQTTKGGPKKNAINQLPLNIVKKKLYSSKLRKNIRSSSVPTQNISTQETDDSLFALSQIKNMDRFISKRINKNVVWKEKMRNIYEINTSRNYKEIKSIKDRIHELRFEDSKNFDLKSEISSKKYFPMEKVAVVNEARNILKKMEDEFNKYKSMNNFYVKKRVDIQTFAKQNREICLKNNMINLLKEESNKIKQKEKDYAKALQDSNKGFLRDEEAFKNFVIEHKLLGKRKELEVEEAIKKRKRTIDQLYQIGIEVRTKYDEVEKSIKNIISCFSYAEFIHRIIGSQAMKNININKLIIKASRNRAKDINYLINTAFELFGFLLKDDADNNQNINFDADQMTYLFKSMETVIMANVNERDVIIKEMETQNNYSDLIFLKKKKAQQEEELNFLNQELDKLNELFLPIDDDYKKNLNKAQKYIYEIFEELNVGKENEDETDIKYTDNEDVTKKVFNMLYNVEHQVDYYINEIETIEKNQRELDDTFRNVIEKVRVENKKIKYQKSKQILERLEEEKLMKLQERFNSTKIKTYVEFIPPWIKNKNKKKKKIKVDKGEEEKQLLYYH